MLLFILVVMFDGCLSSGWPNLSDVSGWFMVEGVSVIGSCPCSNEVHVGSIGKTGSGVEICGACDCCIVVAEAVNFFNCTKTRISSLKLIIHTM